MGVRFLHCFLLPLIIYTDTYLIILSIVLMSSSSRRLPKSNYKGANGFLDPVLKESEQPKTATASVTPSSLPGAEKSKKEKGLRDAVDAHRAAQDMLDIKGSYFPG